MQSRKKRAKKTRGKVAHNPQFGVKYSFIEDLDLVEIAPIKQVLQLNPYVFINLPKTSYKKEIFWFVVLIKRRSVFFYNTMFFARKTKV